MNRWVMVGLFTAALGCANPSGSSDSALEGTWSGVCRAVAGTPEEGQEMPVSITVAARSAELTGVVGTFAPYEGQASFETLSPDVDVYHCLDAACMIGDDPYVRDDVLVDFTREGPRTAPGNGFLYLHVDDPDTMSGSCILIPSGGAGFVFGGDITLTR